MKSPLALLNVLAAVALILFLFSGHVRAQEKDKSLPPLHQKGEPYETPLAGEGFRTEIMRKKVTVSPRDRRSTSAWSVGLQLNVPEPENRLIYPFGALYFWRHPDENMLFRAEIAGVFNELFYAASPDGFGPFEWVATFRNNTVPFDQAPLIDGELLEERELTWGTVSVGLGLGYRTQLAPGMQENMFAVDLLVEPSYAYFSEGEDTADAFVIPEDTFSVQGRLRMRLDKIVRNILELPHEGVALGTDLVYGHRSDWEDWGINGEFSGSEGKNYQYATGYVLVAGGVPLVPGERHRLLAAFHGGVGSDTDRFSAPRVGGGSQPMGQEYGSTDRPVLPGAAIWEFYPEDYALLTIEYRYELFFFTFLSARTFAAYLNRFESAGETLEMDGEYYAGIGGGLTTGFFLGTRVEINFNHNTSVKRDGDDGGNEVVMRVSNNF